MFWHTVYGELCCVDVSDVVNGWTSEIQYVVTSWSYRNYTSHGDADLLLRWYSLEHPSKFHINSINLYLHSIWPDQKQQWQGKNLLHREKSWGGPGSYGRTLLLMAGWVEKEKGGGQITTRDLRITGVSHVLPFYHAKVTVVCLTWLQP